jgi:Fe2+ transport system protein B
MKSSLSVWNKKIQFIEKIVKIVIFPSIIFAVLVYYTSTVFAYEQAELPVVIGIGDSIGEGVHGGDSNFLTQPFSYLNIFAWHVGVPFNLPLVESGPFGFIGETTFRFRIEPDVVTCRIRCRRKFSFA